MIEKNNILIQVSMNEKHYELYTYDGEYPNLMMLLYDKLFLEDFGECKGIGRCGTCHIFILNPSERWMIKERNENNTLSKLFGVKENSRLACQILIDEGINGLQVNIEF